MLRNNLDDGGNGFSLPSLNPNAIANWLETAPLEQLDAGLEALGAALSACNEEPALLPGERLVVAELLRPHLVRLLDQSQARFIDAPLPFSVEAEAALRDGRNIHLELERAYFLAAFDSASLGDRNPEQIQAKILYRSLQHAGHALLWITQQYQRPTGPFWTHLYHLFGLAESRRLLGALVDDPAEPEVCRTPETQFKRTLLFYLANARRLRQRDMVTLFELLGHVGHLAELVGSEDPAGFAAEFAILTGSDQSPLRRQAWPRVDSPGFRFLATGKLPHALLETRLGGTFGATRQGLDRITLERVAKSLGAIEKRRFSRWPESRSCRYVFGLREIIGNLTTDTESRQPAERRKPTGDGLELIPVERLAGGPGNVPQFGRKTLRSEVSLKEGKGALSNTRRPHLGEITPRETPRVSSESIWNSGLRGRLEDVYEGRLLDSGPQGYSIIWPRGPRPKARVGELVGIWVETNPFIGVIRWLETIAEGLRFGIELLAPQATPVLIMDSEGHGRERGLLLPADPVLRRLPELLAPPGITRSGLVLSLKAQFETHRYKVRETRETTPLFHRYEIVPLAPRLGP